MLSKANNPLHFIAVFLSMTNDIYHIVCLVNMEHERPKKAPLGITYVFSPRLLFGFTQSRAVSVHTWKVKRFNLAKVVSFVGLQG